MVKLVAICRLLFFNVGMTLLSIKGALYYNKDVNIVLIIISNIVIIMNIENVKWKNDLEKGEGVEKIRFNSFLSFDIKKDFVLYGALMKRNGRQDLEFIAARSANDLEMKDYELGISATEKVGGGEGLCVVLNTPMRSAGKLLKKENGFYKIDLLTPPLPLNVCFRNQDVENKLLLKRLFKSQVDNIVLWAEGSEIEKIELLHADNCNKEELVEYIDHGYPKLYYEKINDFAKKKLEGINFVVAREEPLEEERAIDRGQKWQDVLAEKTRLNNQQYWVEKRDNALNQALAVVDGLKKTYNDFCERRKKYSEKKIVCQDKQIDILKGTVEDIPCVDPERELIEDKVAQIEIEPDDQQKFFLQKTTEVLNYFANSKMLKMFFDGEYQTVAAGQKRIEKIVDDWCVRKKKTNLSVQEKKEQKAKLEEQMMFVRRQVNKLDWIKGFEKEAAKLFDGNKLGEYSVRSNKMIANYIQKYMDGKYSSKEAIDEWNKGKWSLIIKMKQIEAKVRKDYLIEKKRKEIARMTERWEDEEKNVVSNLKSDLSVKNKGEKIAQAIKPKTTWLGRIVSGFKKIVGEKR